MEEVVESKQKALTTSEIKKIAKASGQRVGKDFLAAWDRFTRQKLESCVAYHNGGRVTLDAEVVAMVCGNNKG